MMENPQSAFSQDVLTEYVYHVGGMTSDLQPDIP